jgi:hypothetical protein
MAQLTLYLDHELEMRMRAAAKASGVSMSKWVATLISNHLKDTWPASVAALAGSWSDLPEADELRADIGSDVPREPL